MAQAERVLQEALTLSTRERADVAAELLASLDEGQPGDRDDVEKAWGAEIERRARRALAGDSQALPWEDVKRRLEDRLTRR